MKSNRIHRLMIIGIVACFLGTGDTGFADSKKPRTTQSNVDSPQVKETIRTLHRARHSRTGSEPMIREWSRELLAMRSLLNELIMASAAGGGEDEAVLLEASVERMDAILKDRKPAGPADAQQRRGHRQIDQKFQELKDQVDDIVAATDAATRSQRAVALLKALSSSGPGASQKPIEPTFVRGTSNSSLLDELSKDRRPRSDSTER